MKSLRTILPLILLCGLVLVLLIQAATLLPFTANWRPYDYDLYVAWGRSLRAGVVTHSYPLPSIVWIFVPLSLLPDGFKLIWAAAPFAFVLYLFRRATPALWLFFPLLVQAAYGQLDGWMILPLYWLVQDRPRLGPLGAVLLMVKPTLAPLTILYAVYRWTRLRRWQSLRWFGGMLGIYLFPAFITEPNWIANFLLQTPTRATESNLLPRGASLWAWWWHGGITLYLFPLAALLIIALVVIIARRSQNHLALVQVIGLIVDPFLYLANLTTLIPLLQTPFEVIALTLMSWLAVGVDILANGWGGAYTLIPIAALIMFALRERKKIPPPDLTHPAP